MSRLEDTWRRRQARARQRHAAAAGRLRNLHPTVRLRASREALVAAERRLGELLKSHLDAHRRDLAELSRTLSALGPAGALERGYAIVRTADGAVVRASEAVAPGDGVEILLHRGALAATVDAVHRESAIEVPPGPSTEAPLEET